MVPFCAIAGFAQMAYQLAYFRHHFGFASTYESCMTKHFYRGRTEAIRSVTNESCSFARAVVAGHDSADRLKALLAQAVAKHVARAGECRNGQGVDRHLYAMQCLAQSQGFTPALFQDAAWGVLGESVLSTSNVTHNILHMFGFGPVATQGYGIGAQSFCFVVLGSVCWIILTVDVCRLHY